MLVLPYEPRKVLRDCSWLNLCSYTNFVCIYSTTSVPVEIPDKIPMIMATKRFQGFLRTIVECSVKVTSSTSVSVSMT